MNRKPGILATVLCLTALPACRQDALPRVSYPVTPKGEIVEDYFGTKIADPYRWMEDLDSKQDADWVAAENQVTFDYLAKLPMREGLRKRITELWNYPKVSIPVRAGGRYFYVKNTGLQRQAPLYVRSSLTAAPSLVLDPNVLSPDGSVSLAQWEPSHDGRLLAYGLSEGGADWRTIHVRDIDSGKDLPDEIRWMRFSGISWTNDSKGFFYSRYPEPPKGKVLEAALSGQTIYYHRIGAPQAQDRLIYGRKDLPTWFVGGQVTEDGRYLLISIQKGSENSNRVYYSDLGDPVRPAIGAPVRPLIEDDDAEFAVFGNAGPVLYLRTDRAAPNRKIISVDLAHPAPANWKTIVPEAKQAIESVSLIGGRLVAQYLVDVQSRVALFGLDGSAQGDLPLPGTGTVVGIVGREDAPEIFYSFSSPLSPTTVFVYDPQSKQQTAFEAAKPPVDAQQYETKALFASSKDGTRVPLFLTWRKGLALDGSHPTMLYGYGGFSISMLPTYRVDVPAWLELGGIWVTANMRGGAEYGEAWHKGGNLGNKQNVFDDFIAVAEYLVKEKYTSPAKLGIMGASNGGLLVGAAEEQRPDLFAVALPAVGVMDMLRYDKFTGGQAWATEYGSSSNASDFAYLIKYSPVQNVKPGVCYPATLVTTADHDDRVVPSHSFKFTAAMQAAQGCARPVLIRVETQGSHGYRPTDRQIAELADEWAFAAQAMGIREK
ncbi:MAG TPA: prolyl oligopeptidase family serine peptidase [Bryobacteraceae bacterium]|nr:prolyl oligopeptidase family serine peptidase [Bryobacteraceae bacterium]